MKYTISIILIALAFLFSSCKKDSPRYIIGVSQCSDDEWRHKMNDEISREALFYKGIKVEIRTAKDNNKKQAEDIHYFINKKVNLLVVAPNEAAPITPIVEEAYNKGIPVIVVDRKILSDKYTAFVGADNYEIGKAVGNYIATRLRGKGTIAELTGLSGSTPAIDRHQGFMSAISKYPSINLLCQEDAGWLQIQAKEKMDSILIRFPKIDIVFAHNDRMAAGAYQSAKKQKREKETAFIGIDALPGKNFGVDLVLRNVLDATFIYPTGGDRVMQIAMDILEKKKYPRETVLSTAIVDKTNARVMKLQTDHITEKEKKIGLLNSRIDEYLTSYSNQKIILYGSFMVLLLFAGMFLILWKSLGAKNRLNKELSKRNNEITNQKEQLELQRDQMIELSKQLEEATNAKLVFFTNISHDFRTPLTLVSDPVDQLIADKDLTTSQKQLLQLVRKNVNILLRLVNQILDFRKYENGKLELLLNRVDLAASFEEWNSAFRAVVRKKHINFIFDILPDTDFHAVVDIEKLERIYFNLLSNSFKFTPENGIIHVNLLPIELEGNKYVRFTIANTGAVISPEHIRNIFERFYKIDLHHEGSGIGLAVVKSFIDMHGGNIQVESDKQKGTVFTVDLPFEQASFCEATAAPAISSETQQLLFEMPDEIFSDEIHNKNSQSVLVIDDNPDIRSYIHQLLQQDYEVIEAKDGTEGVRKAMKNVPDVIISDVMMPGMDGIECCRRLKEELQTCHIPVILLTACSLDEQRIEGFDNGADSYISKPFNSQVLIARVRNLIDGHKRLKQFFGDNNTLEKETICDIDKMFVEKFKKLIDKGISDSELNVEDLGKDMGLSRVQLYRKIKSLTNYAPNELLRIARLKKASALISSSNMTIAEICYEVGFTSPSYFSKCYKEYFGESPTEYLKRVGIS
jgi:signal transduction histidine kinase/DNA-binding response OmpR family regulator/ABC-type xylose transport system substrate-binding protein